MNKDEVLEKLRKLEAATQEPAVTAVIALIEDGRPLEQSLLDGMSAMAKSLFSRSWRVWPPSI